jgi:DNA-binding beta-propeller fold protein YncE/thiol-disulfide isomerase/thioredoxin
MTPPAAAPDRAPEFPADRRWWNVDHPLRLHGDLAGHVVVVVFFASTCIHCRHVLPTLRYLEQRFAGQPFAVVVVHTPEYDAERDPAARAATIRRNGIRSAFVADDDRAIWNAFECRAWPTLVLIDARSRIRFRGPGEPDRERLAGAVAALLAEGGDEGLLGRGRELPPTPERDTSLLCAPTRVAVDLARGELWIADTGNDRLLAVELATGDVRLTAGGSGPGAGDGGFADATFGSPSGVVAVGAEVHVADTGNHLIRKLSLLDFEVATTCGQGRAVRDLEGGRRGVEQGFASPTGVAFARGHLYVAMTGLHQIWRVDATSGEARAITGTGAAGFLDGPPARACFSQPTGLAVSGDVLAVADSGNHAIRAIDLRTGLVTTLAGGGRRAAEHRDGVGRDARFSLPTDLAWHGGDLLVVDTLGDAIRRIDAGGTVTTLVAPGAGLFRPEGIAVHGERAFVADTGNDRVVVVDLATGALTPLPVTFVDAIPPDARRVVELPPQSVRARASVSIRLTPLLPLCMRMHPDVPATVRIRSVFGSPLVADVTLQARAFGDDLRIDEVPFGDVGEGRIEIACEVTTCQDVDAVCHVHEANVAFDVRVEADGPYELWLRADAVS